MVKVKGEKKKEERVEVRLRLKSKSGQLGQLTAKLHDSCIRA